MLPPIQELLAFNTIHVCGYFTEKWKQVHFVDVELESTWLTTSVLAHMTLLPYSMKVWFPQTGLTHYKCALFCTQDTFRQLQANITACGFSFLDIPSHRASIRRSKIKLWVFLTGLSVNNLRNVKIEPSCWTLANLHWFYILQPLIMWKLSFRWQLTGHVKTCQIIAW